MIGARPSLESLLRDHLARDRHARDRELHAGFDPDRAYAARKLDSDALDRALGFDLERSEGALRSAPTEPAARENWSRLSPQIFQTPYAELAEAVQLADPSATIRRWADLGAAYGRLGIVLASIRPESSFEGLEIERARVEEARRVYARWSIPDRFRIRAADVGAASLPDAEVFFIYDFGSREDVERALDALRESARSRAVIVIGRGRRVRDAIERRHPWLAAIVAPIQTANFSVYRSA